MLDPVTNRTGFFRYAQNCKKAIVTKSRSVILSEVCEAKNPEFQHRAYEAARFLASLRMTKKGLVRKNSRGVELARRTAG